MKADRKTRLQSRAKTSATTKPKQQKTELGLQESERHFREMLENIQLIAVLLDLEGRVTYCNEFLLQIMGYTRDEVLGCDWFAQFVPDVRTDVKETFLQGLKRGEMAAHYENPIRTKSGEERFVRFSNTILRDEQGNIIGTTSLGEDITERKRAEDALIESEEKFQMIFKAAPGSMIFSSLPDGKTIEVNGNFSLITGYSREEALGKNTGELNMWADADARVRFLSILQSNGMVRDFEADLNHKSGAIRNGLVSGRILTVQGKKYLISTFYDITDRKRAEEALRENEIKFRTVFENSVDAIGISKLGRHVFVNPAYLELFGYIHSDELTGRSILDLIAPGERGKILDSVQRRAKGENVPSTYETRGLRKDGSEFDMDVHVSSYELNKENYTLVILRDITERKRAEEKLQRNEQLLRLFVEHSPSSIAMFDRHMKYIVASRRYLIDYELGNQDIVGRSHYEIFPEIPERWKEIHRRCLAGATERAEEDPFPRTSERLDWVRWEILPWYERTGEIGGIILFSEVITERKLAEQTQQKLVLERERALNRLQLIMERMPIACILDDANSRVSYWNTAAEMIFGYTAQEMIGKDSRDFIVPPTARVQVDSIQQRVAQGDMSAHSANENITKDGRLILCEWVNTPIQDAEGSFIGLLAIGNDVTERKRAEEEILRHTEELSALNKLSSRVNQNISLNAVVAEAIKEMIAVTQTDIAYLFLRDGDKLVLAGMGPPSGAEKFAEIPLHRVGECMCGLAVTQGKPLYSRDIYTDMRCTWEECKKAGYRSFAALPLRSGEEIIGVAGLACVAERDFESQAEFLETLASQISSGIHNAQLYEEASHHLHQLTALNKAALQLQKLQSPQILASEIIKSLEAILNYTYSAVLLIDEAGERLIPFALSAQKQNASFAEQDKRYVESADIRVGKGITGWVARSGQNIRLGDVRQDERYLGIRDDIRSELCVPLKANERVIGVINIESTQADTYSENDERVLETVAAQVSIAIQNAQLFEQVQGQTAELERRVFERTAQLQSANKELESFSYSVSHDLRAPLRAISGFAEIIARRHRAGLNEEGQHYFDNIIQASERMGHLIDDLLTYSRLGRTGLRLETISLSGVFADIAKDLKGHIDELHSTISIAKDLPDITGDRTLLSQIFINLLENAVKYRKVDVPPQIKVTCQLEGNHVIVSVKDNGIGIPAEYQDKIFNLFQRLHSEEEYSGTGIGLATVKKSVELLGGSVWVESKVGEGSIFFIRLPKE